MLEPWKEQFTISRDGDYGIEITEKTAHKGAALAKLCRFLNVSMNEVMAIGNGKTITIAIEGEDEEAAMEKIVEYFANLAE